MIASHDNVQWWAGRGQAIIPVSQTGFPYYGRASPADARISMVEVGLTPTMYTRLKRHTHNLSYILAQGAVSFDT